VTAHQGYFTIEALREIAQTTLADIVAFASGQAPTNQVCARPGQERPPRAA
jgi:D-lactate dehydrogenase